MTSQHIKSSAAAERGGLGSDAEFETRLTQLMPFLRAFARTLSGRQELAEDMAQGALTKAWQSRRSFTPGTNLKAWLFTILRNEYYSYLRQAWRNVAWNPDLADSTVAPLHEQRWAIELSDTTRAMDALPAPQRDALLLVGVGGFSYDDTAVLLKSPLGTVKSRVARGRQALKEILDSRNSLPAKSRSAKANAMDEILAQLSLLSRAGGSALAGTPMHAGI